MFDDVDSVKAITKSSYLEEILLTAMAQQSTAKPTYDWQRRSNYQHCIFEEGHRSNNAGKGSELNFSMTSCSVDWKIKWRE